LNGRSGGVRDFLHVAETYVIPSVTNLASISAQTFSSSHELARCNLVALTTASFVQSEPATRATIWGISRVSAPRNKYCR
jgi:hypothetical protein